MSYFVTKVLLKHTLDGLPDYLMGQSREVVTKGHNFDDSLNHQLPGFLQKQFTGLYLSGPRNVDFWTHRKKLVLS